MITITLNQIDENKTRFETELKINHFDLNATCKLHKDILVSLKQSV